MKQRYVLTTVIIIIVLLNPLLFGKNLFLRLILPIDHTPLSPPVENCQLTNWPPATEPKVGYITYDVGHNKLTSVLTGRREAWVPIKSYLITHPDGLVLVDPGPDRRRTNNDWTYNGFINHLVNPIRLSGVKPIDQQINETEIIHEVIDGQTVSSNLFASEVTTVIVNHAHSDHTGNLDRFPNAETIINQVEYDHALREGARAGAHPEELGRAAKIRTVSLVDAPPIATFAHGLDLFGDQTVYLIDLPGHTPGQTGVLVRTKTKTVLLASDGLARHEDLEELSAMPGQFNRQKFLESLGQIDCFRKTVPNAVILPGHDEPIGENV